MGSLNRFFRSLVIASRSINIENEDGLLVDTPKESVLERNVDEYINLAVPEYMNIRDVKKKIIEIKRANKKELRERKERVMKHAMKFKEIGIKKEKNKIKTRDTKDACKTELKKQLESIEKRYGELMKKGYTEEKLKVVKERISEIRKRL